VGTEDLQRKTLKRRLSSRVAAIALIGNTMAPVGTAVAAENPTLTPIKHVIIVIGENRTFDHIFATYKPVNKGEKVLNLLSKGIVKVDGAPGDNYGDALQYHAFDTQKYNLTPPKTPYLDLPPALVGGPSTPYVCPTGTTGTSCVNPANLATAKELENGLADDYYQYLLTGGTGQTSKTPDQRIHYDGRGPSNLPPGPFQLTSKTFPYDAYAASPVHRFYQMWQQLDCDAAAATEHNG
jgi:phospholipase C